MPKISQKYKCQTKHLNLKEQKFEKEDKLCQSCLLSICISMHMPFFSTERIPFIRVLRRFQRHSRRNTKREQFLNSPRIVADTTDRGLGWNQFSALFLLHRYSITQVSVGGSQNTSIKGQMLGKKALNSTKYLKQSYPNINRECEYR